MTRKIADPELRRLIDAALSDQLTPEDHAQLERRLVEDDAAPDAFLDACQLETDLFFQIRATLAGRRFLDDLRFADGQSNAMASAESSSSTALVELYAAITGSRLEEAVVPTAASAGATALAAMFVVGAVAWWAPSLWYVIPAERQPQSVAAYTEGNEAEWLGEAAPEIGHRFMEGDSVYLKKGSARISMANGAELMLRAPCFVTLATPDRVLLEEGVVTAQVAEWGRGFTLATNELSVVDLGTKFAVAASTHGAEAHVLDGQVRIQPVSTEVADRRSLLLSSGEAIRVESQKKVALRLAADRKKFDAEMGNRPPFKPIPIFNTGAGLVPGDEDPHWRVIAGPKCPYYSGPEFAVVAEADGRYLANDPARSQWISVANPVRPGVPPSSLYTFEATFDLTGYDLSTVMVAAQVIADNGVRAVRINGQPVPIKPWELNEMQQYFNKFCVVDIKEGFVPGVNKVEFDVWNGVDRYAPQGPNPMSLRVEWQAYGRPELPGGLARLAKRWNDWQPN